jgi:cytochrome P450
MSTSELQLADTSKGGYRFPPGMPHNLAWNVLRRRRLVNPIHHFQNLTAKFGDMAHYKVGRSHIVFINNPEYIREILVVQHANFVKERTQRRSKLLLGEGMITVDGAAHRKQRQVAQPAFHRQQVPAFAETIVRRALKVRDGWGNGEERDIYQDMMRLTLGTIGATLFRTELGDDIEQLNAGVSDIMDVYHAMVLLPGVKYLINVPFTPLNKFLKARKRLYATIERMIVEHRRRGASGEPDLLDMMLSAQEQMGWSEHDLRDQVVTVFLAGYETMAIALTWTWYLLSENQEARERMYAEVGAVLGGRLPTYDDLARLKYTEIVLAESMRLYPPAWAMGREALQDFEIGPYRMPKGTTVLMSQFVTQRDARYFPDPLRFDPERHSPEGKASRPRFSYFPFGMGPRQCIGEAFAWMEGVLVLATFAQKWKMDLVPGHPVKPEPLFTLRPKYGMKMKIEERSCERTADCKTKAPIARSLC